MMGWGGGGVGVHAGRVGSIVLNIGRGAPSGGSSPLHGGRMNKIGLHREGAPPNNGKPCVSISYFEKGHAS